MEGDRAYGPLILLSGGESVEMPVLSLHCTWVLGGLQSPARTERPINFNRPGSTPLLFYF